ncbi:hypothetical protein HY745_05325 [Candidatus Desantisbacteria bacterium]|nr:hypothetical protein [Candidatus Desantisbacteria bacterium]
MYTKNNLLILPIIVLMSISFLSCSKKQNIKKSKDIIKNKLQIKEEKLQILSEKKEKVEKLLRDLTSQVKNYEEELKGVEGEIYGIENQKIVYTKNSILAGSQPDGIIEFQRSPDIVNKDEIISKLEAKRTKLINEISKAKENVNNVTPDYVIIRKEFNKTKEEIDILKNKLK